MQLKKETARLCKNHSIETSTFRRGKWAPKLHLGLLTGARIEFPMLRAERLACESRTRDWTGPVLTRRSKRGARMVQLLLQRLTCEETAQDLAEYGIALATISILAGIAAVIMAKDVGTLWSKAQSVIDSAQSSSS